MIDKSENFYEFDRNYPALKYFKKEEFESPDLEGSGEYMCPDFLQKLDMAREKAKIPFRINSGYRTPEHNEKVGGVPHSSHKKIPCQASDISTRTSKERFIILISLMAVGFTRFGIGKGFIHVDMDKEKPANVMWDYY